jgi:ankyrin repeat protein
VIRFLLDAKADVNPVACDPVLRGACEKLRPDAVKMLLDAGANVNRRGVNGKSSHPLFYAVYAQGTERDKTETINLLLAAGADTRAYGSGKTILHLLHAYSQPAPHLDAAFAAVLAHDPGLVHCRDASGATPLLQVLQGSKDPALVKVLLDAKADPNAVDTDGNTALLRLVTVAKYTDHEAATVRRVIGLLVDAGADLTQCRDGAETPLMRLLPSEQRGCLRYDYDSRLDANRCMREHVLLRDILEAILHPPVGVEVTAKD